MRMWLFPGSSSATCMGSSNSQWMDAGRRWTAVGKQPFQERIHPEQRGKKQDAAVAVLDIGGMNDRVQQQAQRIYENMALLALDLFARIIAMRIDTGPPFSALFTLWLSMMAAVGLASRSPCSRHST
jgi:hypothetical protein